MIALPVMPLQRMLCAVAVGLLVPCVALAEGAPSHPFPGVRHYIETQSEPEPRVVHVVVIAPNTPGLAFKTTRPGGPADFETDTETALAFAERTGAQIAVNANFFEPVGAPHARLLGLAVSNGTVVSPWNAGGPTEAIHFGVDGVITFIRPQNIGRPAGTGTRPAVTLHNAVTGNLRVVERGRIPIPEGGDRHPRTLAGVAATGDLLLVVVDGRQRGVSMGATMHECAEILLRHDAETAINLDGGGSTTLVFADPAPRVVNRSSNTLGTLRANGNHLGVFVGEAALDSDDECRIWPAASTQTRQARHRN